MAEDDELQSRETSEFDPRIQTEKISFDPEEMVACGGCGRMNPPNRLKCLYCAKELDVKIEDPGLIKPVSRKLELWERGHNLVFREKAEDADAAKIARLLSMEHSDLASILNAGAPLPLARVESEKEAKILQLGIEQLGVKSTLVGDADLSADKPPVRLRRIDLPDGALVMHDFNTGEAKTIEAVDLTLMVQGLITTGRIDSLEKKRRGGTSKLIDETPTMADETVVDIYTRRDPVGFRVHLTGFDFSGLGKDKGLLAVENMRQLIVRLKQHAPSARFVSNYTAIRHALTLVWDIESRKDPQGLQRSGFGKVEFGSVASTTNLNQFTKYSRLQWHLYEGQG